MQPMVKKKGLHKAWTLTRRKGSLGLLLKLRTPEAPLFNPVDSNISALHAYLLYRKPSGFWSSSFHSTLRISMRCVTAQFPFSFWYVTPLFQWRPRPPLSLAWFGGGCRTQLWTMPQNSKSSQSQWWVKEWHTLQADPFHYSEISFYHFCESPPPSMHVPSLYFQAPAMVILLLKDHYCAMPATVPPPQRTGSILEFILLFCFLKNNLV